jgi:diguanylate cyclase (GGDEF)-like protein
MVDVDHFKRFNDTHGHVLGDHVLRMVAAKLAQVGGGGRAYRFGGEEFVVLFPGRRTGEVWSHLDALRRDIAAHSVVARDPLREKQAAQARSDRGKRVSVTVSVGVAERNSLSTTADAVLRAADCALYRAKDKGRNCLSR